MTYKGLLFMSFWDNAGASESTGDRVPELSLREGRVRGKGKARRGR